MEEKEYNKHFWKEAATGGLLLGLAMFALSFVSYYFDLARTNSGLLSMVQVAVMAILIIRSGRRVADLKGDKAGFTYGQAITYILAMMLFTGFIYGVGEYVLQVLVAPEYFDTLFAETLNNATNNQKLAKLLIDAREQMGDVIKNPIVMAISGVVSMVFYGGFVGLVASVFIKRPPVNI